MTRATNGMQNAAPVDPRKSGSNTSVQASSRRALRESRRRSPLAAVGTALSSAADRVSAGVPAIRRPTQPVPALPRAATSGARSRVRSIMHGLTSVGAMAGVAALLVSTSITGGAFTPVELAEAAQGPVADVAAAEVQSLGVVSETAAVLPELTRDTYAATAYVKPVTRFVAPSYAYTNNPTGSIQWPFPGTAPITYGFGPRAACSYCSTFHLGLDFVPGAGTPIQAIADGTVVLVDTGGSSYGNHVVIQHNVNGQIVKSLYAHMAWGSIQVAAGQQVTTGTIVGAVGSTGASTGAHLHLEVHVEGTAVDPYAWLSANAG
ncbi:peptidase M23-like protein [Homoserinimonas aerilata]|uniref:Peptidase M23-like protein n=1 Tax=Homoserinimonas aerilata TaxID=1162970 RepID=A0A542YAA8_9MICO|nr:M23 family metallopeptidase [Homoserinimonas aerilata]TQL45015.1 peptidase M23-like protein [Homoserinimonas aerilata]